MTYLLPILIAAVLLAYASQKETERCAASGIAYKMNTDLAYILLVVILVLFAGLRTRYNDTENYIKGFQKTPVLWLFLSDPENLKPFTNPLFGLYESFLKLFTDDPQVMIFTTAAFSQVCFIRFFKRYSENFAFSVFLYITLGTFVFSLAAIKQVLAMAVLSLAFPCLQKKQFGRYYLLVVVAMLLHTYALAFALLPMFRGRPWSLFTFGFLAITAVVLLNFEDAITAFMDQANELGKTIADYEVFEDATINVFRLAVYAVPPLISFAFQRWVLKNNKPIDNILIHMSIISLGFMILGTQSGANMFGRMGNYFELGTICCLPQMLNKTFEKRSFRLISSLACLGFIGFFVYANAVKLDFDQQYRAIGLWQFLIP
jgi:hypothetical protein